jgi:hypothetical protein
VLRALRSRDFRLLRSARLVSALGSRLLVVAVPAYVLELTVDSQPEGGDRGPLGGCGSAQRSQATPSLSRSRPVLREYVAAS